MLNIVYSQPVRKSQCSVWDRKKKMIKVVKDYISVCMLSCFRLVWLFATLDCRLPGSSVHGILQARILEWVAIFYSRGSSQPGIEPTTLMSLALAGRFFTTGTIWEAQINMYKYMNLCIYRYVCLSGMHLF